MKRGWKCLTGWITLVFFLRFMQYSGCISKRENNSFFEMAPNEKYKLAKIILCGIFKEKNSDNDNTEET